MVTYKCDKCNAVFNKKYNFKRHVEKIIDCLGKNKTNNEIKKHECDACDKEFSRKDALTRHSNTCHKQTKPSTIKHKITDFGGLFHDFSQDEINVLDQCNNEIELICRVIELVHFNVGRKQYHNVYYSNIKSGDCKVFIGGKWEIASINATVLSLITTSIEIIRKIHMDHETTNIKGLVNKINDPAFLFTKAVRYVKTIKRLAINNHTIIKDSHVA